MTTHSIQITMAHDDQSETKTITVKTPDSITDADVSAAIKAMHIELCQKEKIDVNESPYDTEGCNVDTLIWYMCQKHHWEYDIYKPAIQLTLY